MFKNLTNKNIQQFFADTTYHCIPPTLKKFRLFVLSGFDIKEKKTHICLFALIPDEKTETYKKIFTILKNIYNFSPKIITIDFSKSLTKSINEIYPECIIIKCFFHFSQALWKNIKKFEYTELKKIKKTKELLFNIQLMCFINPKNLGKFYNSIIVKYEKDYENFFK